MILLQLFTLTGVVLVGFVFLNLLYARWQGAPIVYATPEAIKACWQMARVKPGETVLDLGCGNARSLIIAARQFGARGIGVEASWYGCLAARWQVRRRGLSHQIKIYRGDARRAEALIAQADAIYLYLFDGLLAQIEENLFNHLRPSSRVVSLAFAFAHHQPDHEQAVINLGVSTKIRLYRPHSGIIRPVEAR